MTRLFCFCLIVFRIIHIQVVHLSIVYMSLIYSFNFRFLSRIRTPWGLVSDCHWCDLFQSDKRLMIPTLSVPSLHSLHVRCWGWGARTRGPGFCHSLMRCWVFAICWLVRIWIRHHLSAQVWRVHSKVNSSFSVTTKYSLPLQTQDVRGFYLGNRIRICLLRILDQRRVPLGSQTLILGLQPQ